MSKSKAKSVFTIIYPNLETLMYVRGKYPKLEEMEVGTDIINETFIEVHYLKAKQKAGEVLKDLIYFGTLLIAANRFKPLNDQHNVFHCFSLPQKLDQATQDQEATQVEAYNLSSEDLKPFAEYLKRKAEKQQVVTPEEQQESTPEEASWYKDHVIVSYDGDKDQVSFIYPIDKTLLSVEDKGISDLGKLGNITDGLRAYFNLKYDTEANVKFSLTVDKVKIQVNEVIKLSSQLGIKLEELITDLTEKVSALVLRSDYSAKHIENLTRI